MKSYLLMIMAVLAMNFAATAKVAAQMPYNGYSNGAGNTGGSSNPTVWGKAAWGQPAPLATTGMFGPRTIGGASLPITSTGMFGTRMIGGTSSGVSSTGMFGTRFIGPAQNSSAAGIQNGIGPIAPYSAQSANSSLSAPYPQGTPYAPESDVNNMNNNSEQPVPPAVAPQPNSAPNAPNAPNGAEGTNPAEQGAPTQTGLGTPAAANIAYPRGWSYALSTITAHVPTSTRSVELSNRMTQIARDKGMLVGRRIEVSLYGDIAILQGTVHSPDDRALLASVLSLEPKVQQIDNRLVTEQKTTNLGNLKDR